MAKDNLPKAQGGRTVTPPPTQLSSPNPLLNEQYMEQRFGGYSADRPDVSPLPNVPYVSPYAGLRGPEAQKTSAMANFLKFANTRRDTRGGGRMRTLDEYAANEKGRYDYFMPGNFDNEDAAAQGQSFGAKMVNGVSKGLLLTGTTFLQSTVGLVNGTYQAIADGKFSSFYDNEFNRSLDELNKYSEDALPNYYTAAERDAKWYSPKYWATGNFLWDGVVKNLGFAAGAALSGGVYTSTLKALPYASRLFSVGKAAETLAATEAGLAGASKVADTYGKIRSLSDKFLSNYNTLNPAGRFVVAGLSTTGEAGIEALHSSNEFRQRLIDEHVGQYGVEPTGAALQAINDAAEGSGNATFFANVGLLTATNLIQFPKILGSTYKGEKGIINGIVREIDDIVYEGGKYVKPKTKYPFLSRLNKIRPYTFSTSEAFEEVSQYSATVTTQDYYNKARNGEATSWLNSIGVGITKGAFSDEGAKNALIGGISGSLMLGRGRFMQDRAKSKNTAQALKDLNNANLSDFTKETIDAVNRGTVLQQEREAAIKSGDTLNSKDLEADYIANYLTPRIKYGRYDLVKADIAEYKKLASTDAGFEQLQAEGKALETDTREAYAERLNRFEQTAENFKSLWQSLNLRYSGQLDENGKPIYDNNVMNKMLYAATKVADYDQRIQELSAPLAAAGINISDVIQGLVDGDVEAFNAAAESIKNMDILDENKDTLGKNLDDLSELSLRRQSFLQAYQDIKENPSNFSEAPIEEEVPTAPVETVTVKTKRGERNIEIGTPYFAGKGVDYSVNALDSAIPMSQFVVQGVNENGTLKIKNLDTGKESDISVEKFEDLMVGKVSALKANKTANYYYNHRNEIFEFNFGKNFGGRRKGRLEYQDGKLYFVYLTPKGKVAKKELNNSYFVTQEGFDRPRISKVGSVENQQQKDSREGFMSPSELVAQKATLAKNREARLEVLSQLGEESKESLEETNKKLAQQTEKLAKIKEDLENIAKMKEAGPTGPKIKLNFSKATKVFTKALNNLTSMQADIEAEIDNLDAQKEELELNISYFQDFANQITNAPEDSGAFLQELKNQVALLVDNGKSLNNALSAAKKLAKSTEKAIKSAAKLFRKTLKETYIVDQDYSQYLSDLLDQVVSGENLLETWPLLKQEMANFALTVDLSKEGTVDEAGLLESINDVKQIEKDLADLRAEYKARKIITDRFQSIMDEYTAQKVQEAELKLKLSKVIATADKSAPTDFSKTSSFESQSKKSPEIIYRATVAPESASDYFKDETGKDHQTRANQFGLDLDTFENRDNIRGLYLTSKTQDLKLPGVIEQMLDNDPTLIEQFKDSMIVMVMVNENGELVGVDGQPIPEGAPLLDNAIYQTIPEAGFRDGSMYREGTAENVKDAINKEYKERRDNILEQTALGVPQEIEASFGIPQTDDNARTSVEDAGLVDQDGLERDLVLYVPTTNTNVSKGTTTYNTPLGSVFLDTPTGYVKLRNRLHTKKEATAIYDAILKVAKNLIDPKEGVTSDSSIRALEFLKGVTYWGVPTDQQGNRKDAGNNSVFFEKVKLEEGPVSFTRTDLIIGSKGTRFGFTPSSLEANRELIINELENIYNNVTAYKTKDVNKSFEQITSISPEGEIESITWPNYQSYLLSNKNPDGSAREGFELPLYTNLKEKKDGEFNRVGVYFYTTNTTDEFEIPEPATQVINIPIRKTTSYTLDGKTTNTYTSPKGTKINFRAFESATLENYEEKIQILQGGDLDAVVENIKKSGKDPQQQIKETIYNAIAPQLTEVRAQSAYKEQTDKNGMPIFTISGEDTPAPKAPVKPTQQDTEVKSENISSKGSQFAKKLTNPGNNLKVTYKGREFRNAEHAYQTYKSGEFDEKAYNSNAFKPVGSKPANRNTNYQTMVDILKAKLEQHPELIEGINKRGGLAYIKESTHNVTGDKFWESKGQNKFIEALTDAYQSAQSTQQTSVETTNDSGLPTLTIGDDAVGTPAQQAEARQKIDSLEDEINRAISDANSEDLRVKINQEIDMFEPENWTDVESWLKQNFPNVPVYRVKNIIQATNGRQAWGMFKDGAIYVYENAETGTAYHEVFEAVWKMFTGAEEQANILNEFKGRTGTFVDRPTGKTVKYSEATPAQIKEELAEQFRDFVQKKQGVKGLGARIAKLFRELKKFIENALLGDKAESFTDELFKRIGSGYYKKRMPYATQLSMAQEGIIDIEDAFATSDSEFRLKTLSDRQTSDTVQEMTFLMLSDFIKTDKSLFTIVDNLNQKDFYEKLLPRVLGTIRSKEIVINNIIDKTENLSKEQKERLLAIVAQNRQLEKDVVVDWPRLTEKHKEYIKAYNVEFDENDEIQLSDEDRIKESNKFDATKIDSFRKANAAIKLLLAANPIVDNNGKAVTSSINGRLLNPVSKMYITLMNKLHTSTSPDDMLNRLADMAVDDATYRTLYKRLTGKDFSDGDVDFKNIKSTNKMDLITGMWKTFKKEASDVKNIFIFSNGEVAVGDATLSSGANQLRNEYARSIAVLSKSGKGYFTYNEEKGSYTPNKSKLGKVSLRLPRDYTKFLSTLGIQFSGEEYNKLGKNTQNFKTIVEGIKQSIEKTDEVKTFSAVSLDINTRLLQLAELKTAVSNPEFSSTYFNLQGERVQTFLGVNAASELHNTLANVNNINELAGTQYEYLLKDVFTQGSTIISRMFDAKTGKKKSGANDLLKGGYVGGIIDETKGRITPSARLTQKQRIVQELNLNREGYYLNLVPGDAGMEHMLYMGNPIAANDLARGLVDVNQIFKGYFLSELELAREDRPVVKGRDSKDLRFFKDILGEKLHNEVINTEGTPEEVYAIHETKINQAIASYIQNDVSRMQGYLTRYGVLVENETGNKLILENVGSRKEFDPRELTREMTAMSVNYMIANIELHKVLYSDPYQYKDELKRTKSFLSPRQALFNNSPKANTALNQVWNEGFEKGDIGYTNFTQDYMRTASHKDIVGVIDLPNYDSFEETDGGGVISFKAYRNFRIRTSDWNENEEKQYRYDIAYEKRDKGLTLSAAEVSLLNEGNPEVQSAYTSLKPIVSGAKLGYTYNNVVLDKYALYPLSYRVMKELNAENAVKQYNKMQREDIDYIVFDSGRKVGAESSHATYNEDGSFNDAEYAAVVDVPFAIMSLQSDVPSKEKALVTRGSQTTKLITMDYMDNGVPFDYKDGLESWMKLSPEQKIAKSPIYKEIANNQRLLEEMTNEGYQMMLKRLGITEQEDGSFAVEDFSEAAKTIRDEVFRRETNDNISDAISAFSEREAVLEATPAYQQVRNILYSIVDKQIVSPKISGGQKVQIPPALFESTRAKLTEINGKEGYTSDILGFYSLTKNGKEVKFLEDNKNGTYKVLNTETGKEENIPVNDLKTNTMEIMVGRWFQSDMSDKDLLKYLNTTEEGQKILSGLAFRIPTQKQNSIDVFRIKQFLPKEFGDNVVVPAAIVKKVGSDFDIDKLSIYLKNVFYSNGTLKLVPFYGFGQKAKDKFAAMFDSGALLTKKQLSELEDIRQLKNISLTGIFDTAEGKAFTSLFDQLGISQDEDALTMLVEELKKDGVRDAVVNRMYKQSLENEFIQSSENLVSHPANFERLITPNSADQLKGISKTIVEKVIGKEFDYTNIDNMLDRRFMSRLRQAFVAGKQAIGIAAVQQTNHSLNQRSAVYIDDSKLDRVDYDDAKFLGDAKITFENYNKVTIDGQEYPSLSGVNNSERSKKFPNGQLISDILGQFIDGYVDISKGPWIMEMGATPNVTSTFTFLVKIGVPVDSVAYFMNQPIIRDYLQSIENAGYKFLFIDDFIDITIKKYGGKTEGLPTQIPSKDSLLNSLGKTEFTAKENLEQVFMLQEFLKYAKMANQLYTVTQGTNWDTSRFNDPYLVFKKNEQFNKAKDTIISSADNILENSFIGNQADKINESRNALSNFLLSDRGEIRTVLEKVLKPYVSLPNRTFITVARKAVNDLFDWAVQTDQGLNLQIQKTLLSDKGVASEVVTFLDEVKKDAKHPLYNNHVIDLLQVEPSRLGGETTPSNVSLKNTDSKAYDQNNIIYAFRDLREALKDKTDLYDKIVTLAILQSGLSSSPISFTSLIPYEDFARVYNRTLPKLETLSNLDDFYELGIFQRNNWNNDDIVPSTTLKARKDNNGRLYYPSISFFGYNNLKNAMANGEIPKLATGNNFNQEYQVLSWTNYDISKPERDRMRKRGDYSYRNKGLFKLVKDADGDPIFTEDKKGRRYPIYKAINAFGDSFRANEFYSEAKQSIIDNGMMKVDEVTDGQIVGVYDNTIQTSKYNKPIEGPLNITVKGDRVTVNNRTFVGSMVTAENLKKFGYTDEQIGEIINKKCKG